MRFGLWSGGTLVGRSDLDTFDPVFGAALGPLVPTDAWHAVRRRAEALGPVPDTAYPRAELLRRVAAWRAALDLELRDDDGTPVATASLDVRPTPEGAWSLTAGLARPSGWLARYGAPYQMPAEF